MARVAPDHVPTEAGKFKSWADGACGEWPEALQIMAYRAWEGMAHPIVTREQFVEAYRVWLETAP